MNLIRVALFAASWLASVAGSPGIYGPLNTTVDIGDLSEPSAENELASNNLIGLLEYVRRLMPVGTADVLPRTEPYVRRVMAPAEFNSETLRGEVELTNLVVSGAQDFTINDIQVQPDTLRIDFDIGVPEVIADLDYCAINFKYEEMFVFNVSGHVQIQMQNYNAVGAVSAERVAWGLFDDHFIINALHVENIAENVQTDVDGSGLPSEIIDEIKDVLFTAVGESALSEMHSILSHFSQDQISQFLKGDGSISY